MYIYCKNKFLFYIRTVALCVLLAGVMIFYFAEFALLGDNVSDMNAHAIFALELKRIFVVGFDEFKEQTKHAHIISYPVWHLVFLLFHRVTSSVKWSVGLTNSFFVVMTYIVTNYVFYKEITSQKKYFWAPWLAFIMTFVGPLYIPIDDQAYYLGQFLYNVWHNPTMIAVKPIAIMLSYLYIKIVRDFRQKTECEQNPLGYVYLTIGLVISAFIKPSFFQAFVPAIALFCIVQFLVEPNKENFCFGVKSALAVVPVCCIALLQMLSSLGGAGGVGFGWLYVWQNWTDSVLRSLILSLCFPIAVCIGGGKQLFKDSKVQIAICFLVSATIQFSFLYLKVKPGTGDFAWAAYLATGMIFIVAIIEWCNLKTKLYIKILLGIILGIHFICGLDYWLEYFICKSISIPLTFGGLL